MTDLSRDDVGERNTQVRKYFGGLRYLFGEAIDRPLLNAGVNPCPRAPTARAEAALLPTRTGGITVILMGHPKDRLLPQSANRTGKAPCSWL